MERTLHGSCACGRNTYIIQVPPTSTSPQLASILFDSSHRTRRHQATPFTAYLRVPLTWYHSSTSPLFPDETPALIRRTFHEPADNRHDDGNAPASGRRQFCGFCGTPLSSWHERTPADAEFIALTLGSLRERDVGELEDMGLFSHRDNGDESSSSPRSGAASPPTAGTSGEKEEEEEQQPRLRREVFGPLQVVPGRGAPWFERLVEESRLGRIQRARGGWEAGGGGVREEWEVMEWSHGG